MKDSTKKIIIKQIIINSFVIVMAFVIYMGASYAIKDESKDNKDLLIETGNMQVVLNVPSNQYEFNDLLKEGISDVKALNQEGYAFSIKNTGNIPVEYYEIRLVDQENKVSTLPHKYLRFTINKNNGKYTDIRNLGDTNSIIYSGNDLEVGKTDNFNLKLWIDEASSNYNNKELYLAMEVTLYQKFDIYKNYVLYSSDTADVPVRTSIYEPVSTIIPKKDGYTFLGWGYKPLGDIVYQSGSTYKENIGRTLYAIWEINN